NSTAANGVFLNTGIGDLEPPTINFRDNASASQAVLISEVDAGGIINFYDNSTADHAMITNEGFSEMSFWNESTAADATIITEGGDCSNCGSAPFFEDNSTGGNGPFTVNPGLTSDGEDGFLAFDFSATAGTGTFIANGSKFIGDNGDGASIDIRSDSSADHGT